MRLPKHIKKSVPLDTCENVEEILNLIAKAISSPGAYEVTIQPKRLRPSPTQRGLYRIWVRQIANHTGNTQLSVHQGLAKMYLTTVTHDEDGREIITGDSTEDLTAEEMGQFLDWVAYFASTALGIRLDAEAKCKVLPFTTANQRAA